MSTVSPTFTAGGKQNVFEGKLFALTVPRSITKLPNYRL